MKGKEGEEGGGDGGRGERKEGGGEEGGVGEDVCGWKFENLTPIDSHHLTNPSLQTRHASPTTHTPYQPSPPLFFSLFFPLTHF